MTLCPGVAAAAGSDGGKEDYWSDVERHTKTAHYSARTRGGGRRRAGDVYIIS